MRYTLLWVFNHIEHKPDVFVYAILYCTHVQSPDCNGKVYV